MPPHKQPTRRLTMPTMPRSEAPEPEQPNGHGDDAEYAVLAKGDARGKRVANRTPWLDLPDPFDNLKIRVWLDYPKDVADLWTPQDGESNADATARVLEACKATFLAHDDWEDDDGTVLPQPDTNEFWERISTPLGRAIVQRFFDELNGNPTSGASRKRTRRT